MRDPGEETVRGPAAGSGSYLRQSSLHVRGSSGGRQPLLQVSWCMMGGRVKAPSRPQSDLVASISGGFIPCSACQRLVGRTGQVPK